MWSRSSEISDLEVRCISLVRVVAPDVGLSHSVMCVYPVVDHTRPASLPGRESSQPVVDRARFERANIRSKVSYDFPFPFCSRPDIYIFFISRLPLQ